ncbi:energy transducer TonB [Hymenobacter ruricola]|uniref:Energy transducer TonB n=1 Tax=Hymenobacter ruricola TaxID=2791023 RepID=A0ABS0IB11_9BACT|nr:energy transducer TonB [Hymenobacter ruricola]MBF9223828.1 energy transducer TonB [Hymenobacter ruricola]
MLLLPTFNAVLNPCPVDRAALVAHPQGHFCGHCQRVVQDFSQSAAPVADLAAARAASADGRVCGSFGRAQVAAPPTLTRRLRWFLLALVLVVGQGLTAREALAQVRWQGIDYTQEITKSERERTLGSRRDSAALGYNPLPFLGIVNEVMPTFRGGGISKLVAYIQQQVRWPAAAGMVEAEGRVFVSFVVGKDGLVQDVKIVKGLHPLLDAEALRVIQALPAFVPGQQNGQPVAVSMTVPIKFQRK